MMRGALPPRLCFIAPFSSHAVISNTEQRPFKNSIYLTYHISNMKLISTVVSVRSNTSVPLCWTFIHVHIHIYTYHVSCVCEIKKKERKLAVSRKFFSTAGGSKSLHLQKILIIINFRKDFSFNLRIDPGKYESNSKLLLLT